MLCDGGNQYYMWINAYQCIDYNKMLTTTSGFVAFSLSLRSERMLATSTTATKTSFQFACSRGYWGARTLTTDAYNELTSQSRDVHYRFSTELFCYANFTCYNISRCSNFLSILLPPANVAWLCFRSHLSVYLCVCLSCCNVWSLDLSTKSSLLVCGYIFIISSSNWYIRVIGSGAKKRLCKLFACMVCLWLKCNLILIGFGRRH